MLYPSKDYPEDPHDLIRVFLELRGSRKKEELGSEHWKALERAYLDHLRWRFEYPARNLRLRGIAAVAITLLAVGMTVAGLVFSFAQLDYAMEVGNLSYLPSDLAIETAGRISISSSVIGGIVLVSSLAFFYLYLRHVFRIQVPFPPPASPIDTDENRHEKP